MTGKDKCRMLKEIRRQTAEANGIPFNTEECKFKGECKGTCPKCEAELKYINEQLERRKRLGAAAAAVVMSAGLLLSTTACTDTHVADEQICGGEGIFEEDTTSDIDVDTYAGGLMEESDWDFEEDITEEQTESPEPENVPEDACSDDSCDR